MDEILLPGCSDDLRTIVAFHSDGADIAHQFRTVTTVHGPGNWNECYESGIGLTNEQLDGLRDALNARATTGAKRLWKLAPIGYGCGSYYSLPAGWPEYDSVHGFVVCARDEEHARNVAAAHASDEGVAVWRDSTITDCNDLGLADQTEVGLILRDFHAG